MTPDPALFPTPLARMLEKLATEQQPFRAVHRLVDTIEVFAKLHTVAGVCAFADAVGGVDTQTKESVSMRVMLAAGLRTPSLGTWWQFARESARALKTLQRPFPLPGADDAILKDNKSAILKAHFDTSDPKYNLITFRNSYAHGATPSDDECSKELAARRPQVFGLLERATWLQTSEWLVRDAQGQWWRALGPTPTPLSRDAVAAMDPEGFDALDTASAPRATTFLRTPTGLLSLDPLLSHADGHAWFYNDLRDKHVNVLNYPQAEHRKAQDARVALLQRFPIEDWRRLGGHDLDPFRERIEALTEVFRGRAAELTALASGLGKARGFQVVWGPPGVGKSALLARFVQLCRWAPELRAKAAELVDWASLPLPLPLPDDAAPERAESTERADSTEALAEVFVVEFLIRRGTNATAAQMFDSLNQRLDLLFSLQFPTGTTDLERRTYFDARLRAVSERLAARADAGRPGRLLIVVDGLDEAEGSDDPLLGLLPRTSMPHVRVLYGARPTLRLKHVFYDELDREHRAELELKGLGREDTRALLYAHVDKYRIDNAWLDTLMTRSDGNPLYLRLLCQGLQDGVYALGDALGLPAELKVLYANALIDMERRTPGATRLLALLAAARDYVPPAMAAELLGLDEGALVAGPLSTCRELLFENPLTAHVEDYQLFHESLREYISEHRASEVTAWAERLSDWCAAWRTEHGDPRHPIGLRRTYAMRHAVDHLAQSARRAEAEGQRSQSQARWAQLRGLVEDPAWREASFAACGEAGPMQRGIVHVQRLIKQAGPVSAETTQALLRWTLMYHDEPLRLYEAQRKTLRTPVVGEAQAAHLERVVDLARMGAGPRVRVMLALSALWATQSRPKALPKMLTDFVQDWLEEARDPALDKLWKMGVAL